MEDVIRELAKAELTNQGNETKSKYVSMFRLDGQPILPPLMTAEKRLEMQRLRQKASILEKIMEKNRLNKVIKAANTLPYETFVNLSQPGCSTHSTSYGKDSELDEAQLYASLTSMMQRVELDTEETIKQTEQLLQRESKEKCVRKLKKSETLVYDNVSNEIVIPFKDLTDTEFLKENRINLKGYTAEQLNYLCHYGEKENTKKCDIFTNQPSSSSIPEICVDPPTPVAEVNSSISLESQVNVSDDENDISGANSISDIIANEVEENKSCNEQNKSIKVKESGHEIRRSATSPSIATLSISVKKENEKKQDEGSSSFPVVRSSSFTLESPSKALIEHLRRTNQISQQIETQLKTYSDEKCAKEVAKITSFESSASFSRDTVESRAKKVKKVEVKQNAAANARVNKIKQMNVAPAYKPAKVKRSPYEAVLKKEGNPVRKTTTTKSCVSKKSSCSLKKPKKSSPPSFEFKMEENILTSAANEVLGQIEACHRQKFMQLIAEQAYEQQKLQHAFEQQQKILLEQLKKDLASAIKSSNSQNSETPRAANSPLPGSQNSSGCTTPSLTSTILSVKPYRKTPVASAQHKQPPFQTVSASNGKHHTPPIKSSPLNNKSLPYSINHTPNRKIFHQEGDFVNKPNLGSSTYRVQIGDESYEDCDVKRHRAATIINAYARGFLVRRLLQTEQVQRIAQTVKDTLLFVLNLHLDSLNNPDRPDTADGVRLKARLIHQLEAASRTFHLVFFQTSVKERMEIISRDRQRIKTKLLAKSVRRQSESLSNKSFDMSLESEN